MKECFQELHPVNDMTMLLKQSKRVWGCSWVDKEWGLAIAFQPSGLARTNEGWLGPTTLG
eukprot:1148184-Pelagomonas_calceolata.AAC.1